MMVVLGYTFVVCEVCKRLPAGFAGLWTRFVNEICLWCGECEVDRKQLYCGVVWSMQNENDVRRRDEGDADDY